VILPTDTVYGLACSAFREEAVRRLYALKGRSAVQPTALVASSVDALLACVPELRGPASAIARAVLPGPFTLVLPNPAQRFRWLSANRADTIGVRVPLLTGDAKAVVDAAGAVAATSANLPGGPDPRRLTEIPGELLAGAAVVVDGGELPGIPSTVIDVTGPTPVVLREGAVSAEEALRLLAERVR
jgi:L-threonylcarbamoyladenylate synthase